MYFPYLCSSRLLYSFIFLLSKGHLLTFLWTDNQLFQFCMSEKLLFPLHFSHTTHTHICFI